MGAWRQRPLACPLLWLASGSHAQSTWWLPRQLYLKRALIDLGHLVRLLKPVEDAGTPPPEAPSSVLRVRAHERVEIRLK